MVNFMDAKIIRIVGIKKVINESNSMVNDDSFSNI